MERCNKEHYFPSHTYRQQVQFSKNHGTCTLSQEGCSKSPFPTSTSSRRKKIERVSTLHHTPLTGYVTFIYLWYKSFQLLSLYVSNVTCFAGDHSSIHC